FHLRLEMATHRSVDDDLSGAVGGGRDDGTAGHEAGGQACADLPEIVAIEIGRHEAEDDDEPDRDIAEDLAHVSATAGENTGCEQAGNRQQEDHLAEILI